MTVNKPQPAAPFKWFALIVTILGLTWAAVTIAQPPPRRRHTANQRQELELVPANQTLPVPNQATTTEQGAYRIIRVNSIPEHKVGQFPNRGNPHSIEQLVTTFRVPREPQQSRTATPIRLGLNFGVAVNGVLFDPGAAEFWMGDYQSGWQYEALGGAVPLGLDTNYAHVQPTGKYHYHGLPTGLLQTLNVEADKHSPLVGWAADGFPIYAMYGFSDPQNATSEVVELQPSFRLKKGNRPAGRTGPGGTYDGTFVNDYEYVEGLGDLDECNGRACVTPEFPEGTYAYFLTQHWPTVPRSFRGTPDDSFQMGPPGGGGRPPGPPQGRPPFGGPPPR
ncbi:MAG: YHYH protein [Planctomycetaceae bacterium]|nr:YHYH protein [Planctomycetaceae bacterium]